MNAIHRRLRALERKREACAACGGNGAAQLLFEIRGAGREPPVPRPCPRCGRVGAVSKIVFVCGSEEDAASLDEWTAPGAKPCR